MLVTLRRFRPTDPEKSHTSSCEFLRGTALESAKILRKKFEKIERIKSLVFN